MAENLGERSGSFSQKRPWVLCHPTNETETHSSDTHRLEAPLPFSKRSRSEQDFTEKGPHIIDPSQTHSDLGNPNTQNGDQECKAVIFTIGDNKGNSGDAGSPEHCNNSSDEPESRDGNADDATDNTENGFEERTDEDDISDVSGMSDISVEGAGWRPMAGPISWVQHQMANGADPRQLLRHLLPDMTQIPEDIDQLMLWKLIINIVSEPPRRKKLTEYNTLDDAVQLIQKCKKIIVLTGAGVSVSCGIPDFRSRDGIYARLAEEYPDLPDPQAMFDIHYFKNNPRPFFKFAKEIYPGQFEPSKSHKFIKLIESHNKLLHNYTQNIDTLEQVAGIKNIIQCHGSFATATCMVCKYKTDAEAVREDIMQQVIPRCPNCPAEEPLAIMKPDIVFFGESLPDEFHDQMELDKDVCDLLIVIGSSLKVRPVALIPNSLEGHIPQILINREPLRHLSFDIELLGDGDIIVEELCRRLGDSWSSLCTSMTMATEISRDDMSTPSLGSRCSPPPPPSPPHTTTPPNSEENTRMSFQVASDENSCMSITQDSDTPSASTSQDNLKHPHVSNSRSNFPIHSTNHQPQRDISCSLFNIGSTNQGSDDKYKFSDVRPNLAAASVNEDSLMSCDDSESQQPPGGASITSRTEVPSMNVDNGKNQGVDSTLGANEPAVRESLSSEMAAADSESSGSKVLSQQTRNELEELRACWKPKVINLGSRLKDNTFLFLPPSRYVFQGAEVYDNQDDSDSDSDSSSGGSENLGESEEGMGPGDRPQPEGAEEQTTEPEST